MNYDDRQASDSERRDLEDRLRHLRQPAVPGDLRDKILATIPMAPPTGRPIRLAVWRRFPLGVAAGLIMAFGILLASRGLLDRAGQTARLQDTAPGRIVRQTMNESTKETRPCDILPPLPQPFRSPC